MTSYNNTHKTLNSICFPWNILELTIAASYIITVKCDGNVAYDLIEFRLKATGIIFLKRKRKKVFEIKFTRRITSSAKYFSACDVNEFFMGINHDSLHLKESFSPY